MFSEKQHISYIKREVPSHRGPSKVLGPDYQGERGKRTRENKQDLGAGKWHVLPRFSSLRNRDKFYGNHSHTGSSLRLHCTGKHDQRMKAVLWRSVCPLHRQNASGHLESDAGSW